MEMSNRFNHGKRAVRRDGRLVRTGHRTSISRIFTSLPDHSKEIVMLNGVRRAGHIAIKELKNAVSRKG